MIRREVTLKSGAPLSYAELTESQRRISALGLYRRVRITGPRPRRTEPA